MKFVALLLFLLVTPFARAADLIPPTALRLLPAPVDTGGYRNPAANPALATIGRINFPMAGGISDRNWLTHQLDAGKLVVNAPNDRDELSLILITPAQPVAVLREGRRLTVILQNLEDDFPKRELAWANYSYIYSLRKLEAGDYTFTVIQQNLKASLQNTGHLYALVSQSSATIPFNVEHLGPDALMEQHSKPVTLPPEKLQRDEHFDATGAPLYERAQQRDLPKAADDAPVLTLGHLNSTLATDSPYTVTTPPALRIAAPVTLTSSSVMAVREITFDGHAYNVRVDIFRDDYPYKKDQFVRPQILVPLDLPPGLAGEVDVNVSFTPWRAKQHQEWYGPDTKVGEGEEAIKKQYSTHFTAEANSPAK